MTTDEAREVLNRMLEANKFTSHPYGGEASEALKMAIKALEQPVYHYLPEVPEDGEMVIGDLSGYDHRYYIVYSGTYNRFYDPISGEVVKPYAWTRIPPKPPVKEGGQDGNA